MNGTFYPWTATPLLIRPSDEMYGMQQLQKSKMSDQGRTACEADRLSCISAIFLKCVDIYHGTKDVQCKSDQGRDEDMQEQRTKKNCEKERQY